MKTTKDLFEVYKPKSPDEQKFVDKHVTIKLKDRNGNGDDVFNGNTKPIDRKKERHGYDVGEDEKVYEETEELDELSKGTLSSYVIKATHPSRENSISNLASKGGFKNASTSAGSDDDLDPNKNGEKEDSKSAKRSLSVIRAVSKLTKEDIINRTIEKYITPVMPEPLTMEERLVSKIDSLSESHIYLLLNLFESLNEDNQFRMLEQVETPEGVTELLDFAIENRGV
jgi:hypothetical protein